MTDDQLIAYYAGLIILQYLDKPNAFAFIQALVTPLIMNQLPLAVQNAYNLTGDSPAVGAQLDILGKYAGVTRTGTGFNGTPITLDDSDFLTLINMAILRNNSGSDLATIINFLNTYFPNEIFVFDNQNMQMSYLISSSLGSQSLIQLFVTEGLLPKPMGVQLASIIYAPDITHFYGFRTYDAPGWNVSPMNTYDSYNMSAPWLSYADSITP